MNTKPRRPIAAWVAAVLVSIILVGCADLYGRSEGGQQPTDGPPAMPSSQSPSDPAARPASEAPSPLPTAEGTSSPAASPANPGRASPRTRGLRNSRSRSVPEPSKTEEYAGRCLP